MVRLLLPRDYYAAKSSHNRRVLLSCSGFIVRLGHPMPPQQRRANGVAGPHFTVSRTSEAAMTATSGEPWSEMDIEDLRHWLDYGNMIADTASLLCRDEDEVRQKAKRAWGHP